MARDAMQPWMVHVDADGAGVMTDSPRLRLVTRSWDGDDSARESAHAGPVASDETFEHAMSARGFEDLTVANDPAMDWDSFDFGVASF